MESIDPIIRDGFHILKSNFCPPAETTQLEPQVKRGITICNLFVNYQLSIKEVARILDESLRHVVHTLIQKGIVQERRSTLRQEAGKPTISLFESRLKKTN